MFNLRLQRHADKAQLYESKLETIYLRVPQLSSYCFETLHLMANQASWTKPQNVEQLARFTFTQTNDLYYQVDQI